MASNGFFRVCQNGEGPLLSALREIKQVLCEQSLFLYYIKQIDSMLPYICPVIDHRWHQNVVRTTVTHSAIFCSYHILTSSVIYYRTDARQHGIYLLSSTCYGVYHLLNIWPPSYLVLFPDDITNFPNQSLFQVSTNIWWKYKIVTCFSIKQVLKYWLIENCNHSCFFSGELK